MKSTLVWSKNHILMVHQRSNYMNKAKQFLGVVSHKDIKFSWPVVGGMVPVQTTTLACSYDCGAYLSHVLLASIARTTKWIEALEFILRFWTIYSIMFGAPTFLAQMRMSQIHVICMTYLFSLLDPVFGSILDHGFKLLEIFCF